MKLDATNEILKITNNFNFKYLEEENKLPYRFNLLDDLKTNENAHNLVLTRILGYKPALIHFIEFLNKIEKNKFYFDIKLISNPIITAEKMRIDALIREQGKYAIIIENKINYAEDQYQQVERYIDKCKTLGYSNNSIYILYLTRKSYNVEKTSHQSWGKYAENKLFDKQHLYISYENEILPWLKEFQSQINEKDNLLKSALIQYIDHIEHLLNNEKIYKNMNKELNLFLTKELNLNDNHSENLMILSKKNDEIEKFKSQIEKRINEERKELFKYWYTELHKKYADKNNIAKIVNEESQTGVVITDCDEKFSILVEYESYSGTYIGYSIHHASEKKQDNIEKKLKDLCNSNGLSKPTVNWYGWKSVVNDEVLVELTMLIDEVLTKIDKK